MERETQCISIEGCSKSGVSISDGITGLGEAVEDGFIIKGTRTEQGLVGRVGVVGCRGGQLERA